SPSYGDCPTRAHPHNPPLRFGCCASLRPFGCAFGHPLVSQRPYEGEPVFLRKKSKGARYMKPHPKPTIDVPKWASLLVEAVNKPGMIMEAYSAFHNYSIANQILALVQCQLRGLEPGPINTFPGWQALGRTVKRGERALTLCMP